VNGFASPKDYSRIDYDLLYADLDWEPVQSNGPEDKGYCFYPWQMHKHGDTTGKLAINRDKGVYNCWVCGGGTLPTLISALKDCSYEDAVAYLFSFAASDKASPQEFYEKVAGLLEPVKIVEKTLPYFNPDVLEPWEIDHEWFASRDISSEVRKYFRLGFNGNSRTFKPGLGTYEGPAIILPHFWKGKLVGWQNRWLDNEGSRPGWVAKYTNTTGFPREFTVWGFAFSAVQSQRPILVESVPTALRLISTGRPAMATFGSQITEEQLRLLRGFQSGILLAPDNDGAGTKWLQTAKEYLQRYIEVGTIPCVKGEGSDLGDLPLENLDEHLKGVTYGL
jgi:DNA primase